MLTTATVVAHNMILVEQIQAIKTNASAEKAPTADDAMRIASTAWNDASFKHEQSANQVLKLRENLKCVQDTEQETANMLVMEHLAASMPAGDDGALLEQEGIDKEARRLSEAKFRAAGLIKSPE
ncbi:unnamed protein product, partial [Prorocentrum cordatum]